MSTLDSRIKDLNTTNSEKARRFLKSFTKGLFVTAVVVVVLRWVEADIVPPWTVAFSQSARELNVYDFVEIAATVSAPHLADPFTDATLRANFSHSNGNGLRLVEGFCDAGDGSVYRVRFMPPTPGDYTYSVEYRQGWYRRTSTGRFHVTGGTRRGPIRIDPQNRWHFIWEGTGEHYFFNGTTAYWLMGWRDDQVIRAAIERLHELKINRMRVTIAGRTNMFYGEPAMAGENWTPYLKPWPSARALRVLHLLGRTGQRYGMGIASAVFDALGELNEPTDINHPGFDYSRFEVAYWQKFERALKYARDRDMIISLVLDMNDSRVHPAARSADERRFIRYAIARFAAFSNIMWDLGVFRFR